MLSLVKGKDRHERRRILWTHYLGNSALTCIVTPATQKKRKYVKQKPQTAPTDGQPASESSEDESA